VPVGLNETVYAPQAEGRKEEAQESRFSEPALVTALCQPIIAAMRADQLARNIFDTIDEGLFQRLYQVASVEPESVFADLREAGHDVSTLEDLQKLPTEVLDSLADNYIRRARRKAAVGGVSLGIGGWLGLGPGLSQLLILILRLSQRISLVYGFDYRSGRGELELWKALAAAVGASLRWEGTEAEIVKRLPVAVTGSGAFANPLLMQALRAVVKRVALLSGRQVTRWLPLVGGGTGMVFNYLEVGRIGNRLKANWRAQHVISRFDPSSAIEVEIIG